MSIRTTPAPSPWRICGSNDWPFSASPSISNFVGVAAKRSSETTGIVLLVGSKVVVPETSVSVGMRRPTPLLMPPKPEVKCVVAPGCCDRVRNLNEDQRWPSSSSRELTPEIRRRDAVATTGKLATVRDMQSSTSAAMTTGMPPVVMMYAAWTRDTTVVTTAEMEVNTRVLK